MASEPQDGGPVVNTDRHLWPDVSDPGAIRESIFVTAEGGIGINVGGYIYVKPLREWHNLAGGTTAFLPVPDPPEVIPSNEETQAKDAQIERFAETLSEAYGLLERAHSILSIREGAMKTAKCQALLGHIARFMDGFPPETQAERECECIPQTVRTWKYCTDCGGCIPSALKAGAFCSRCGGTDPACYICGSNAQKVPAEPKPCEHLRSELLAEKKREGETLFEMRKCLDCTKIFRVRSSLKTGEEL
jgi:hypothetical protein